MRFYYDNNGYECTWKTQIKGKNTWWNMEPVKLKVRIPISLYRQIILDINDRNEQLRESKESGIESVLKFKIHKELSEKVSWGVYSSEDSELWEFTTLLDRISYTSKFNDETVMANFDFLVQEHNRCDKSELREIILNEIL